MAGRVPKRERARLKAWLEVRGRCLTTFYDELDGLDMVTDEILVELANIRNELNWFSDFVKKA